MNNPNQLTPEERLHDTLLRFENFERASQQSTNTRDGKRAEPPPRAVLSRELAPA